MASYAEIADGYLRLREGDAQRLSDRPSSSHARNPVRPEGVQRTDRAEAGRREGVPPRGSGISPGGPRHPEGLRRPDNRARKSEERRLILDGAGLDRTIVPDLACPVSANVNSNSDSNIARSARTGWGQRSYEALAGRVIRYACIGSGCLILAVFVVPRFV